MGYFFSFVHALQRRLCHLTVQKRITFGQVQPIFHLWLIAYLLFFSACKVDKFLQKDQYIVRTNKIKLQNIPNKRSRTALLTELTTLHKQRDLPSFLVWKSKSGAWFYFQNQKDSTANRFKKRLYRNFERRPSIYDPKLKEASVKNMKQYLINAGYYYPTVVADHDFYNRDKGLADITYTVTPGILYVIDTIQFFCTDTAVQYLLNDTHKETFFQHGQALDIRLFEREKTRITEMLNNFGYARFTPNYISQLEADTTDIRIENGQAWINLNLTVQAPTDRQTHQKFITNQIIVYPNFNIQKGETIDSVQIYDNKLFFTDDGQLGIKLPPLSNAIPLQPFEPFSKEKADKAVRLLSNLGIYKFVNIRPNVEECDSSGIVYKIFLTPAKKMSFEAGLELNYSNIASFARDGGQSRLGRAGIAGDFGFNHRNLFGGAERFRSVLSGGADIGLSGGAQFQNGLTFDIRFDNTLSIPKFINVSKSGLFLQRLGLLRKSFYTELKENASTDITLGYIFSDRLNLNLYRLQQFNLGYRYVLKRKNGAERYVLTPTGVDLQLGELTADFDSKINERFRLGLLPQFMTGFGFRSLAYEKTGLVNPYGERWQINATAEQSGTEIWTVSQLFFKGKDIKFSENLPFSKYGRVEIDFRYTRQFSSQRAFAGRLAIGAAFAFGNTPVPYARQFFVGGPNSIRGWLARGIGPGNFQDTTTPSTIPFQAGDIKMEFNSEYRFPLFWRFESAILFDAGNIWNFTEGVGVLDKFWYNQVAISSGIGLRLDVTYAKIRVDFGFRLRNPYPVEGQYWIPVSKYSWANNVNPNFALGFPF
jgi:outer membrane protein assembly factor BamA